jgi:hypothetical protein
MAHNDVSRPVSQWVTYSVPNARDLALWDRYQYQAVSGDLGGTWIPKSPIVIGGTGLTLLGPASSVITQYTGGQIIGGVTTQYGGRMILGNLGAGPGDEVVIGPPGLNQRRTLVMPIAGLAQQAATNDGTIIGLQAMTNYRGVLFGALSAPAGSSTPPPIIVPIPSRYMHNGAVIKSGPTGLALVSDVYFGWRLTGRLLTSPARVPATILSANIFWINSTTFGLGGQFAPFTGNSPRLPQQWVANTIYSSSTPNYVFPAVGATSEQTGIYYKCTTSGTSNNGSPPTWPTTIGTTVNDGTVVWTAWGYGSLAAPSAATPAGYYQAGAPQTIRISPATDVTVDTTQYAYFLQIQPDTCGVGWLWTGLEINYTNIGTLAFE